MRYAWELINNALLYLKKLFFIAPYSSVKYSIFQNTVSGKNMPPTFFSSQSTK